MYRVITKSREFRHGQMRRKIDVGPWHKNEVTAETWAKYLKATGFYDRVEVEFKGQRRDVVDEKESEWQV